MKNMIRCTLMLFLLVAASMIYGAVPVMSVTVSNGGGKAAFKGATNSSGAFATPKLTPGNYVVQFASNSAPKGSHYAIVVSAGKKKVVASAVAAEKLSGGGVAMKVDVGAGLNITGQVATESKVSKDGKKMVWVPPILGSNQPGHWVEENSAEAKASKTRTHMSNESLQKMQENSYNPQG